MTQTIEQLTARVRELEEENTRLKAECDDIKQVQFPRKLEAVAVGWKKQLAAEQLNNKRLRDALLPMTQGFYWLKHENFVLAERLLSEPLDTSALDAYVAKRLHDMACDKGLLRIQVEELTRQRDLAVEALKWIASSLPQIGVERVWMLDHANKTLAAIKESEGK